jgi:hypothetical protein
MQWPRLAVERTEFSLVSDSFAKKRKKKKKKEVSCCRVMLMDFTSVYPTL